MTQDKVDILASDDFYTLNQMRQMQRAQLKLAELKERGEEISRITGKAPVGYFAYERAHPTPRQYAKNAIGAGTVRGAITGGLFGWIGDLVDHAPHSTTGYIVAGVGVGAVVGGAIGAFTKETEEARLNRSLGKYESYIGALESALVQTGALSHADTVLATRLQPAQKSLS